MQNGIANLSSVEEALFLFCTYCFMQCMFNCCVCLCCVCVCVCVCMGMMVPRLETEVNKWDDSSNDIVLLAKEICWMVMDMSDFTR